MVQAMINPPTTKNIGLKSLPNNLQTVVCSELGEGVLWVGAKDDRLIVVDGWTVVEDSISSVVGADVAG